MTKKTKIILVSSLVILLCAGVCVTLAFMFRRDGVNNSFFAAKVSCKLHEGLDGATVTGGTAYGTKKHSITVENTGNTKAFVRVRLTSHWVDEDGNVIGHGSKIPTVVLKDGWFSDGDSTFYFEKALSPGELSDIMCEPLLLVSEIRADGTVLYQAIELSAEAIQATPETAVLEGWGVTSSGDTLIH